MPLATASKLVLLSTLAVPVVAVGLQAYLIEHPLSSSRTCNIRKHATLSRSCASSSSLSIVNPNHHKAWTDSFSIRLSRRDIGNTSDEELLSKFVKGFFGGWIFAAESSILMFLHAFGRQMMPVSFSNISTHSSTILSPSGLSRTCLPPLHAMLFGGNFMILDINLNPCRDDPMDVSLDSVMGSHVDFAFGDDRKSFAGFHRFEVTREIDEADGEESRGATICYSSIACNPSANEWPAPSFTYAFHKVYALNLFRDGIAGVLEA